MNHSISQIRIKLNDSLYLKNPESSELGNKILQAGIIMIAHNGLDKFTFGKLAKELRTTESSIYRYFENKHKFLMYITSWYWGWLEYLLLIKISNIENPEEKLKKALNLIIFPTEHSPTNTTLDLNHLVNIVISESAKAYLTKEVDTINKEGAFVLYKRFCERLSDIIIEINPSFTQPHSLVSTIVEGIHHQKYFAEHLPSLTDFTINDNEISDFYYQLTLKTVKNYE